MMPKIRDPKEPNLFFPGMGSLNSYMENEVLMLRAEGLSSIEIAKRMRISWTLVDMFLKTGRGPNKIKGSRYRSMENPKTDTEKTPRPWRVGLKYKK